MRFNKMMAKFEPLCETAAMVNDQTMEMVIETLSKLTKAVNEAMVKKGEEKIPVISGGSRDINTVSSTGKGRTNSSVQNGTVEIPDEEDPNSPVNDIFVPIATLFPVKDPIIKKRHPGRQKGSRHKTLAETGYKKSNNKNNLCRDVNAVVAPLGKAVKGKAVKGKGKIATTAGTANQMASTSKGMASTCKGKATTSTAKGKANVSREKVKMSKEKATKAKTKPPVKRKRLDGLDA
ncbi:uncharacterized protein LOC110730409 [Chenopodium quinoa]|uniref:uncharacterized protein LOC110730409 n=1 Tax=Chenopodium quinoa TaxID=63459 RepID=UPI000B78D24C|nr:uncharacterized protein LOC110730409 [Chenopodium quinoa]